ncbi:hypothetical protein HDV02_001697 [Globomyces sp. JEL0801]|nr:hypothetical protein HDV02_001697 [Globomyces sp. JEL0801]
MNSSYLSSRQSSFTSTDSSALKRIQKSRQLIDSNRPQSARTISSKSTQRANIKQTELVLNMSGPKPRSRPSSGASRLSSSDSIGKLSWISNQNSADWLSTSSINSNETITEYKRVSIKDFDFPLKSNGIQTTNHHHIYKMDEIKKTNDPFMIRAINEHPSPEKLDLNRRSLQTCPQLEDGEHIKLLDLQNNLIVKIDHLHHLRLLVFLDFYNNQIEEISGLDRLLSLRVLMLGRNKLSKIQGLESLVKLDILDLHSNRIKVIENLGNLFNLRVLNLEDNLITVVPSLIGCQALGELNLKKNKIWSFHGNGHLKKLYRLSLNDNKIALLCDIEEIFGLENLTELSMEQNKISENSFFKTFLVSKIPTLKLLDGRSI